MKKLLLLIAFILPTIGITAPPVLDILPGMWKYDMNMNMGGKDVNILAEAKKMMAQLPKEVQDQMKEEMNKQLGTTLSDDLESHCITKEELTNPEKFAAQQNEGCTTKVNSQTKKSIRMDIKCKGGESGTVNINVVNQKHFTMETIIKDPKHGNTKLNVVAKFASPECKK